MYGGMAPPRPLYGEEVEIEAFAVAVCRPALVGIARVDTGVAPGDLKV